MKIDKKFKNEKLKWQSALIQHYHQTKLINMKTKICEKILSFDQGQTTKQTLKINWKTGEENQIVWT